MYREMTHEQEQEMIIELTSCREYGEIAPLINKYVDKYDLIDVMAILGYCIVFNGKMEDLYKKQLEAAENALFSE